LHIKLPLHNFIHRCHNYSGTKSGVQRIKILPLLPFRTCDRRINTIILFTSYSICYWSDASVCNQYSCIRELY